MLRTASLVPMPPAVLKRTVTFVLWPGSSRMSVLPSTLKLPAFAPAMLKPVMCTSPGPGLLMLSTRSNVLVALNVLGGNRSSRALTMVSPVSGSNAAGAPPPSGIQPPSTPAPNSLMVISDKVRPIQLAEQVARRRARSMSLSWSGPLCNPVNVAMNPSGRAGSRTIDPSPGAAMARAPMG